MKHLAIYLRLLQLYAQNCHNMIYGESFFADHEFIGSLYDKADGFYDSTVERMIGLGEEPDLLGIQEKAVELLGNRPKDYECEVVFEELLKICKTICKHIDKISKEADMTSGTVQLITTFSDVLETDIYKLQQRSKEEKETEETEE